MKQFTRAATLAVGVIVLVGGVTPPAQATTSAETTFVGRLIVGGGIGHPVITLGPQVPTISCLPLPADTITTNCHPVYDHLRDVTFASTTCTDEVVHVAKPGKPAGSAGACTITAAGTITGHCGQSGAQLAGTYRDSKGQAYAFNIHVTDLAGEWVITGHVTKSGRTGKIIGVANVIPVVNPQLGSCTNKTQWDFLVVGETNITIPTT